MRVLVIETASAACSVALIEDECVVDFAHEAVGRGHAERLLPLIAALEDGGRPDAILVDVGPGSFTGIRVGLAAARALGSAWGVPVTGYHSLALLAAIDGYRDATAIVVEGGHGEVFVARNAGISAPISLPFAQAGMLVDERRIVGDAAQRLVDARGWGEAIDCALDARSTPALHPQNRTLPAVPFYGRGADAKPMA